MVFVVKPSVCFSLQVMCRVVIDYLDVVPCIFGSTFLLAVLRWPNRSALGRGYNTFGTLALSCMDIRYLVIRRGTW